MTPDETDEHPAIVIVEAPAPSPSREPVTVPETPDSIKKSDRPTKEPTP